MTGDTLFDGYEPPPVPATDPGLSAGQRLTLRQAADIAIGRHPLSLNYGLVLALHPEASRERTAADGRRDPFTCGSCVHRQVGGYPKCTLGPQSRGPATDVRAWWPACTRYEEAPR